MLCRVVRCCVVVRVGVWGGGGCSLCAASGHFGRTHSPYNQQGPYKGPTWGYPTASGS